MNRSDRHSRSILFPGIGEEGQARIARSSIAIVGLGAIGSVAAESAARAGFGRLTLIDRDVVENSNLSRQFLFDAEDARQLTPKAAAAAARLRRISPDVSIEERVLDLNSGNARQTLSDHDVVLDGSDNFETRLLVSDTARFLRRPSIYAACVGEEGLVVASVPGRTPCLRCYLEDLPPAGSGPTCDTVGIVPTLPALVASAAMTEALRLCAAGSFSRGVLTIRIWEEGFRSRRLFEDAASRADCPVCSGRGFPALEGEGASEAVKLCGRGAVQISPAKRERPDFEDLARRLARVGSVRRSQYLLSADLEEVSLTIFADGRCVVRGTDDLRRARGLYERYVGR